MIRNILYYGYSHTQWFNKDLTWGSIEAHIGGRGQGFEKAIVSRNVSVLVCNVSFTSLQSNQSWCNNCKKYKNSCLYWCFTHRKKKWKPTIEYQKYRHFGFIFIWLISLSKVGPILLFKFEFFISKIASLSSARYIRRASESEDWGIIKMRWAAWAVAETCRRPNHWVIARLHQPIVNLPGAQRN